jgi:hypothetical protein
VQEEIESLIDVLPASLREQVYSYVNSVAAVADDIFADARVNRSDDLMRALIFIATLRKLFGIVGSSYWAVSNALSATKATAVDRGAFEIRIGRSRYARGTREYDGLEALFGLGKGVG